MQILYSHDWTSTFCIGKLTPEEKKSKDRKVSWILVNSRFDSSFVKLDILPESLYHEDIDCTEKSVTCIGVFLFLLAKSCDNSWPYLFEDGWQWQKAQVNYLDFWSWEKFDCWAVEKSWGQRSCILWYVPQMASRSEILFLEWAIQRWVRNRLGYII